jgi:death-on-curing protein
VSEPEFLTLDEVLAIHADQIRRYGGATGLRDLARLCSAMGMPETTFDGEYLHSNRFDMAAAYLFHLARNHPFIDGDKRTALMCALVFLGMNGQRVQADPDSLYALVDGAAAGKVGKSEVSIYLQRYAAPR